VTGGCTERPLLEECIAVLMVTKNSQSFSFTPSSLFGLKRLVGNLAVNGVCPQSRLIGVHDPFHRDVIFRHSQSSLTSERLNSIIQATCQCSLISFPALSQPLKLNISLCLECRPYSAFNTSQPARCSSGSWITQPLTHQPYSPTSIFFHSLSS
jgi:hypothetical protein